MPDILLVQPPIEDFYLTAKRTLPYGLASIAAAVRRAGFSVDILDGLATAKSRIISLPEEMSFLTPYYGRPDQSPFGLFHHYRHFGYSLEHMANQARRSGAFLIGISSLFTAYSDMALSTAAAIKKACPDAHIVMGGHHPTALPEAVMADPSVDFVLRGDGEIGMPLLAQALQKGGSLNQIPGLVWRRDEQTVVVDEPAVVNDLGDLPLPSFDLVRWTFYQRRQKASLSLSASRGCPMRCSYCAVNAASYHGFRRRSVEHVMAELEAAAEHTAIGFIDFEDEHLCADKRWFLALMKAIANRWGKRPFELRAMNGLYAPGLDETLLDAMQQSGFQTLNLALVATAADQLKRFKRPDISQDVDRVLQMAEVRLLDAIAYLIIAGPFQEPHDSLADLLYLAQRRVLAGVSVYYPAPGSQDYPQCQQMAWLPPSYTMMRATALPLAHRSDRTQTVTLLRLGRILNFMKALMDQGRALPTPSKRPRTIALKAYRQEAGEILLAGFLNDGTISGVDDTGRVYDHRIDMNLSRTFLKGLRAVTLRGAQT